MSNSPAAPGKIRYGSCLCKKVRYRLTGEPLTIRVCHCVNCRKATGSAFMVNSFWYLKSFEIVQGAESLRSYRDDETASRVPIDRTFCSTCGSNVYMSSSHAKNAYVVVGLGTLDDETDWVPETELFPEQRRHWVRDVQLQPRKAKL